MDGGSLFEGGGDALRGALDRVVAQAQLDEDFRSSLLESPRETLEKFGLDANLARGVAGELGLFGTCEDTCINNTGADCKSSTCRLTDSCGWTVCDTTNKQTFLPDDPFNELRITMNGILDKVVGDDSLKKDLLESPAATLRQLGVQGWAVGHVMRELGIAPVECNGKDPPTSCINSTTVDCKDDTCRITDPCGWTVCGQVTNYKPAGLGRVNADQFLEVLGKPAPDGGGGGVFGGGPSVWPEKKKRELWTEPESGGGPSSADLLAALLGRKKQLEREVQPGGRLSGGEDDLLDQLAEAVAERLRYRG
jgi:hypothetical protein